MLAGTALFSLNDALGKWLVARYPVGGLLLVRSVAAQSAVGGAPSILVTLQLPAAQATALDAAYRGSKIDLALVGR